MQGRRKELSKNRISESLVSHLDAFLQGSMLQSFCTLNSAKCNLSGFFNPVSSDRSGGDRAETLNAFDEKPKKEDTLMNKKYEVNIMIKKNGGDKEAVVRTRKRHIWELSIRMLFEDAREILVLDPSENVETAAIKEIEGDWNMGNSTNALRMPVKARPDYHQSQAFDFACERFGLTIPYLSSNGVALLMEMGTGKSITSAGITGALYQSGKVNRVLIVCPISIVGVWQQEFESFADYSYDLTILSGSSAKKKEMLSVIPEEGLQIVVINYESTWRIQDSLEAFNADLIICDEAHKIKEARTAQSKCLHKLGDMAKYKLLLTGTVITNKELDVFSQYRFLNREIYGCSFYQFRNRYFDMVGYGNHIPRFKSYMRDDFLKKLHSVAFRVTKEECLNLPDIIEEVRTVDLEPKVMKMYQELEKESFTELEDSGVSAVNVLTKLLRLSQLAGGHLTDDDGDSHTVSTAKLSALEDIVDSAVFDDKKLVVMARFVPELNDIQEMLDKKGIGYVCVRGGVKDRAEKIRRFQEEPECRIFIGQIAAGGLGITLTAASTMVFYSLDYSMSNFEQAKARIHCASQKNDCLYIYLVAKGTVDRKVLRALQSKVELARMLVDDYRTGKKPFRD